MRTLVINADDFGYDPDVSRGIEESMRRGVVTSTTMMVNTPHSEHAAARAAGLSIGLHLNLARHAPLDPAFPPLLLKRGELSETRAAELPAEVVERETLAQLARLEALVSRPATHVDVHKHLHRHPRVLEGVAAAAVRAGLKVRSIDAPMRRRLRELRVGTNDHFVGDAGLEAYWTAERFEQALAALPPEGFIELMCHPGYTPRSVTSAYSAQREVELKTFGSSLAKATLSRHGLTPGPWR